MTMRILPDMTVRVFINGQKLPPKELNWALSHTNGIVQLWSQIDNLLSRYSSDVVEISNSTKCKMMSESIQQIGAENDQQQHTLMFIGEQLSLTFRAPNGRRYTTDTLILAFTWFHKSSAYYQIIQRHLALPRVRMLRDVASYLNVGANNTTFKYLQNKVNYLNLAELLVTLQLDEIHVKPKVSYQSGQLYGNASNRNQKQADRIQVFMISSVLSLNKDVVSLVPVQKMTAQDLCSMTLEVIKTVTAAGYNIVAILSDNNVINSKMFMELSGTKTLVPFNLNPVNKIERIYLLLEHHKLSYVLLGKFQTDNVEARFGQYRMMCGTNYLVTVKEVLQSEKKLKVNSLLKLYSRAKGVVKEFLEEFSDPCKEKCDNLFLTTFPYAKITTKVSDDALSSLLYTSGYVARKAMSHTDCNECKDLFGNKHNTMDLQVDPEHLIYTEILDRGGLIYPSNLLFKVLQVAYNIFSLCVASDLEGSFLRVTNQRYTLIGVIEQHLSNNDDFIGIYYTCDECGVTYFTRLLRALMCFSNICLNNYSKNMSDSTSSSKKQSQKKTVKLN